MPFEKGNQFWKQRTKHGRDKLFSSPQVLFEEACKYFQWCDDNPWHRVDFRGKDAEEVQIPTQRPYTWEGLENYLGIYSLRDYKTNEEYSEFKEVITMIGSIITQNKMEGAMVGAYNANIVARDLGLVDKKQQNLLSNNEPIDMTKWT